MNVYANLNPRFLASIFQSGHYKSFLMTSCFIPGNYAQVKQFDLSLMH